MPDHLNLPVISSILMNKRGYLLANNYLSTGPTRITLIDIYCVSPGYIKIMVIFNYWFFDYYEIYKLLIK